MTSYRIQGATGEWEVVIGLEVHAQVTSNAKLFSGASTAFGAEPNTQVSLIDAAMPGMLPVPNKECIRQAVRTGMAIEAQINTWSRFDRKNYFYADLPQGYQISQLYHPIVGEGQLLIEADEKAGISEDKIIGIERIHVEQDAGKLMHDQHPTMSYVDLNRTGVALMEIVSKPDMRSPAEAGAYVRKLRAILRYVGSCDGNMEEGSMRADVNVSVRKPGEEFGTRTETKNVNSVRFVMQVIEYEANRQVDVLENGGTVDQETRLFDPNTGTTRTMCSKEDAHDYRYFPDPDLLPLEIEQEWVDSIKASLPELPDEKRARFVQDYGLSEYDASVLVQSGELQVGDMLLAGAHYGRVRALVDETGQQVKKAGPSIPVEVLGLDGAPEAGEQIQVVPDEKKAREVAEFRQDRDRDLKLKRQQASKLENLFENMGSKEASQVNIVLKTDVRGSLEALVGALHDLSTDEVKVSLVSSGVGAINESDVNLAITSEAVLLGFNVRADSKAKRLCEQEGIDLRYYSVIYELIDDVKQAMSGLLAPEKREEILGVAEVRDVFRSSKFGAVAGCMVVEGTLYRNRPIRVLRDDVVVFEGELESLRRFKDDVQEVRNGVECGIAVKSYNDVKAGDKIEVFEVKEVARSL